MEITYIDNSADLIPVREKLLQEGVLGFDLETAGFDCHTKDLSLLQIAEKPDHSYVFNMRDLNDPHEFRFFTDILADPQKVKIAQNGKFDLQFITKFTGGKPLPVESLYDTMIASKIIARGDPNITHGLGDIALHELGEYVDKSLQKSDFGRLEHTEEQLMYAGKDAAVLLPIRDKQKVHLENFGLERVARLEFDAVPAIADTEYNGFYLDAEEWAERIKLQTEGADRLRPQVLEFLRGVVPQVDLFGVPYVNIDSSTQMIPILKRLGVPLENSADEDSLMPWRTTYDVVKYLLEYREFATALKKFGLDYLDFINPVTGRIHASFWQLTAPSGRMSCSKPNLQQLPREKIYRKCWKAQNGGKIISADYSQIELRIMAMQSGDPKLVAAFKEGRDLHDQTAVLVLGCTWDNIISEVRDVAKNLNFGTAYGVGYERFSQLAGIPPSEAEKALADYWKVYFVLDAYLKRQGFIAADQGYAKTHSGRTVLIPKPDPNDRRAYGAAKRLGRNFSVQGTGADILKRALYLVRNDALKYGYDYKLVNIVHDEIVAETNDDAEYVAERMRIVMAEAAQEVLLDIPVKVGIKVGDSWSK